MKMVRREDFDKVIKIGEFDGIPVLMNYVSKDIGLNEIPDEKIVEIIKNDKDFIFSEIKNCDIITWEEKREYRGIKYVIRLNRSFIINQTKFLDIDKWSNKTNICENKERFRFKIEYVDESAGFQEFCENILFDNKYLIKNHYNNETLIKIVENQIDYVYDYTSRFFDDTNNLINKLKNNMEICKKYINLNEV